MIMLKTSDFKAENNEIKMRKNTYVVFGIPRYLSQSEKYNGSG